VGVFRPERHTADAEKLLQYGASMSVQSSELPLQVHCATVSDHSEHNAQCHGREQEGPCRRFHDLRVVSR